MHYELMFFCLNRNIVKRLWSFHSKYYVTQLCWLCILYFCIECPNVQCKRSMYVRGKKID